MGAVGHRPNRRTPEKTVSRRTPLLLDARAVQALHHDRFRYIAAEKVETPPSEEIAEGWKDQAPGHLNLHTAVTQLMGAVAQSNFAATEEQQQRIADIVNNARREIYNILGETNETE